MNNEIFIIEQGTQDWEDFPHWHLPEYTHTMIPELADTMRMRVCRAIILNWESGFTVLERGRKTFTGTQRLGEVYTKLRKIVSAMRIDGELQEEQIPLMVVSSQFGEKGKKMFSQWGEALFIAKRIMYDRTDDTREVVYLAKNSQHAQKLRDDWRDAGRDETGQYDWTKKITVRIEADMRDILGPIEAREYPEFIRIPRTMRQKMYIGERELELAEDEALGFMHPQIGRKDRKTKRGRIVPLIDRDNENIPDMLERLTLGRTHVSIYGRDCPSAEQLCYLDLDIPKTLSKVLWI